MTYRRRYFAEPQLPGVLDLLLRDRTNPRSLAFQLAALERLATELPDRANYSEVAAFRDRLAGLARHLEQSTDANLGAGMEVFVSELAALSDLLTQVFFSHVMPRVS
jgi:uncharacterized alpha-E superfamily protein